MARRVLGALKAIRPAFRDPRDAMVLAMHLAMRETGLVCVSTTDRRPAAEMEALVLPVRPPPSRSALLPRNLVAVRPTLKGAPDRRSFLYRRSDLSGGTILLDMLWEKEEHLLCVCRVGADGSTGNLKLDARCHINPTSDLNAYDSAFTDLPGLLTAFEDCLRDKAPPPSPPTTCASAGEEDCSLGLSHLPPVERRRSLDLLGGPGAAMGPGRPGGAIGKGMGGTSDDLLGPVPDWEEERNRAFLWSVPHVGRGRGRGRSVKKGPLFGVIE